MLTRGHSALRSLAACAVALAVAVTLPACAPPAPPEPLQGTTMGTTYMVRFAELPEGLTTDALQALIEAELDAVNAAMSTYDPEADISRFNRHDGTDWFRVDANLAGIVKQAQGVYTRSDGAFDPTIGPLVDAWGFGRTGPREAPPAQRDIDAALMKVGMDRLDVRVDPPALRKRDSALQLDLSAIAKGHGVDRLANLLGAEGVTDYLVEIGGELRTAGRRPDGGVWRVGIEQPVAGDRQVQRALPMALDGAVATSGDYRNFFETDGRRYGHLLDPRTGRPVTHTLASVTVIAADCATADGWATALHVLGPDAGFRVATEQGLPALFIERDGDELQERSTAEFDNWLAVGKALLGETTNND